MPSLVSLWNGVWAMTAEIPYWWCVTTQIWVVLLIGSAVLHEKFVLKERFHCLLLWHSIFSFLKWILWSWSHFNVNFIWLASSCPLIRLFNCIRFVVIRCSAYHVRWLVFAVICLLRCHVIFSLSGWWKSWLYWSFCYGWTQWRTSFSAIIIIIIII